MRERVGDAFLGAQAPQEIQIGLAGLHGVFAGQMGGVQVLPPIEHPLRFEHAAEDVRHTELLEHTPVRTQAQPRQRRFDYGGIAGPPKAGGALRQRADDAVHVAHRLRVAPDGQHGGLVEQ